MRYGSTDKSILLTLVRSSGLSLIGYGVSRNLKVF
jgi:hypothetical protein